MTKLLLRSGLLVGGVALAAVTVQHVVQTDGGAAAEPVNARAVSQGLRRVFAATRVGGEVADVPATTAADASAQTGRGGQLTSSPGSTHGGTESTSGVTATLSRLLGLRRPDPGVESPRAADQTTPAVLLTDPVASSAASAPTPTAPSECRSQDLQVQAQGVSASVSFVGILLAGSERQDQVFSGAELSDLKIVVQWSNLFSHHRQRVELIAPDGSVYQSLSRPLTTANTMAPVELVVPVSGTWITRYGLYGAWCVDVFFDQDEKPVASRALSISS
jgi:hypothetical protein